MDKNVKKKKKNPSKTQILLGLKMCLRLLLLHENKFSPLGLGLELHVSWVIQSDT